MTLLVSLASAEVTITEQPKALYNLGDTIRIPIKITTLNEIDSQFTVNLICNGVETLAYFENIILKSGEEKEVSPLIPLKTSSIGRSTGTCKIKTILGEEIYLTDEFTISDYIKVELKNQKIEVKPGEEFTIELEATKENGNPVIGFMDVEVIGIDSTESMSITNTIKNGYGYGYLLFSTDTKAGQYLISINISEKDIEGKVTNKGFVDYNILVLQVPTSLEIILENANVEPGSNALIKTILHDQTGEPIEATSLITISDGKNKFVQKNNYATGEFLEVPIIYNEPPAQWTISAESSNLTNEATFEIIEKTSVDTLIVNKTLIITNNGNVHYNNTIFLNIENSTLKIDVDLGVDEFKKYLLSAPNGEYEIKILTEEGEPQIIGGVTLTGKAISVKEASEGIVKLIRHPFSWFFILAILGFVAFNIYKKGYKRSFFGRINIPFTNKNKSIKQTPLVKNSLLTTKNKAELTLSIKGDKQDASLVCLKIKNLKEIQSKKSNVEETLQKIVSIAEGEKAAIYENQDNIFFILAPVKTKTFNNSESALSIAQKIKELLEDHNKKFNQKIDVGISLNIGTIVAKQEQDMFRFMSMGTLITHAKKIASISQGEIYLSERIKDKLATITKTGKQEKDGIEYYSIKEIKNPDANKKFINSFLKRIEKN